MRMIDFAKTEEFLKKYVLKTPKAELVAGFSSAAKEKLRSAASKFGFPVVLKVISKDIPCMSAVGVVQTVDSPELFDKIHETLLKNLKKKKPNAKVQGILVQKHISGQSLIVVVRHDAQFGAVVQIGAGVGAGCCTELEPLGIAHMATGFAPLDKKHAEAMAAAVPTPPASLADFLIKVSRCGAEQHLDLAVDVFFTSAGIEVVDAKLFEC